MITFFKNKVKYFKQIFFMLCTFLLVVSLNVNQCTGTSADTLSVFNLTTYLKNAEKVAPKACGCIYSKLAALSAELDPDQLVVTYPNAQISDFFRACGLKRLPFSPKRAVLAEIKLDTSRKRYPVFDGSLNNANEYRYFLRAEKHEGKPKVMLKGTIQKQYYDSVTTAEWRKKLDKCFFLVQQIPRNYVVETVPMPVFEHKMCGELQRIRDPNFARFSKAKPLPVRSVDAEIKLALKEDSLLSRKFWEKLRSAPIIYNEHSDIQYVPHNLIDSLVLHTRSLNKLSNGPYKRFDLVLVYHKPNQTDNVLNDTVKLDMRFSNSQRVIYAKSIRERTFYATIQILMSTAALIVGNPVCKYFIVPAINPDNNFVYLGMFRSTVYLHREYKRNRPSE